MYTTLSQHYQEKFGCKVYKLAIDAGFTCPNRDGTAGVGGCTFCAGDGSGFFAEKQCATVAQQLENAKKRVEAKNKGGKYIAYFQSFTNTYASVSYLKTLYCQAMEPEDIVGLSIGTRPDCLSEEVVACLAELNQIKPISVELGLQTIHQRTADAFHRGYETHVYYDAVKRLKKAGIEVVTHLILGLPGETKQMMLESTQSTVNAGTDGIKFHLLHVLGGTQLEEEYQSGAFSCLTLEEYGDILKDCLALVPQNVVIHRITGDGAKKDLVAPMWSADKKRVLNYLNRILK
ncbi:MAG: TIGR01212 family radical SAM protein [Ruminococcaceae bacterium]|nr:TIGR01212 family radical SAM protein [Oscillospiraceae bacterium]